MSCDRVRRLHIRSSVCLECRRPALTRACLGSVRSRLWFPLWCFSISCRRNIWCSRNEPELGLFDHGSRYFIQHLQHILWQSLRSTQRCRAGRREVLPGRTWMLSFSLLGHFDFLLCWNRPHPLGHSAPTCKGSEGHEQRRGRGLRIS